MQLGYEALGIGKLVQKSVWIMFCNRVVDLAEGEQLGDITTETVELDEAG